MAKDFLVVVSWIKFVEGFKVAGVEDEFKKLVVDEEIFLREVVCFSLVNICVIFVENGAFVKRALLFEDHDTADVRFEVCIVEKKLVPGDFVDGS